MNTKKENLCVFNFKHRNFTDVYLYFGIALFLFLLQIKSNVSPTGFSILIGGTLVYAIHNLLKLIKLVKKVEINFEKQEFIFKYLRKTIVVPKKEIKDIVISFNEEKKVYHLILTFYLIGNKKILLNVNYYFSLEVGGFLKVMNCIYTIFKPTELSISRELIFEIVEHSLKRGKHLEIESKIIKLADELLRKLGTDFEKFAKERNIYDDYFWSHYYKND